VAEARLRLDVNSTIEVVEDFVCVVHGLCFSDPVFFFACLLSSFRSCCALFLRRFICICTVSLQDEIDELVVTYQVLSTVASERSGTMNFVCVVVAALEPRIAL
jgi:hypothetical protein